MRYALTVLTNGRPDCLARTLAAFEDHVTPRPSAMFVRIDGPHALPPITYGGEIPWTVDQVKKPQGFGAGTAACMDVAGHSGLDWTFHLEDDFVILRPIDLRDLMTVMNERPHLAQMSLMRTPVNAEERESGGFVALHPHQYERHACSFRQTTDDDSPSGRRLEWMETVRNWTTNPHLVRTSFLRDNPWPTGAQSEGRYGFEVRERNPDARFGLYGWGECQVAHVGHERAPCSGGY